MKRLLITASLMTILAVLVDPAVDYLNRQSPINPDSVSAASSDYNSKLLAAQFHGSKMVLPGSMASDVLSSKSGDSNNIDKHIEVDLTNQKVYAFEGDKKVYDFLVSTGKWGRTPTGEFHIWTKLKYALMAGGSKALNTYYYLPNVPYTMYFYGDGVSKSQGYGLHGTYWHHNFGHPMSHGCVNMKTEDAKELFSWAASEQEDGTGTRIVIYGTAPKD